MAIWQIHLFRKNKVIPNSAWISFFARFYKKTDTCFIFVCITRAETCEENTKLAQAWLPIPLRSIKRSFQFPWRPLEQTFIARIHHVITLIPSILLSFLPRTVTLWNRLPRGSFPEHDNLNLFKSNVNHYLSFLSSQYIFYLFLHSYHKACSVNGLPWVALESCI